LLRKRYRGAYCHINELAPAKDIDHIDWSRNVSEVPKNSDPAHLAAREFWVHPEYLIAMAEQKPRHLVALALLIAAEPDHGNGSD
jgi:hypothetical protein